MITPLEGNRIISKVEITRETVKGVLSFPAGSIYTISHVFFRPDCESTIAFAVDQMPGLLFDSWLPIMEDDFTFTDDMIKNWVTCSDHPEGI